ncbi:MAG: amidohydrolase family protein [Gemmatimonadota bacterium]
MRIRLEAGGVAVGIDSRDGRVVPPDDGLFDTTIALADDAELRPGLINAHDHLHRNHYPRLGSPPYPDAYAWGRDIHTRHTDEIALARSFDHRDAIRFGALKNLLGGATTVVHHDPWEAVFLVRVPRLRVVHSLEFERDLEAAVRGDPTTRERPLCLHLAEGVNDAAAEEVRRAHRMGLVDDRLLVVHAVGVDDDGIERLRRAGAAMAWCPTSNAFLFGRTAPAALLRSGIDVLLGTDALLTGEGTPLDELRAARRAAVLDDDRLIDAVGRVAARRLGLPPPSLEPGAPADVLALSRPLLGRRPADVAGPEDVALVMIGGVPRLGDERFGELFERAGVAVEPLRVGTTTKLVPSPLGTVAARVVGRAPECGRILETRTDRTGADRE